MNGKSSHEYVNFKLANKSVIHICKTRGRDHHNSIYFGGQTVFRTDVDSNDQSPRVNIRVGDGDTTPKKTLRIYVRSENRPAPSHLGRKT